MGQNLKQGLQNDSADKGPATLTRSRRPGHRKGIPMKIPMEMKTQCANIRTRRSARAQDRFQRRIQRIAEQKRADKRAQDLALARLVNVLEHAHADKAPHVTGRFRVGDEFSRLARLRAAHATYALATMDGLERVSDGAFVRA